MTLFGLDSRNVRSSCSWKWSGKIRKWGEGLGKVPSLKLRNFLILSQPSCVKSLGTKLWACMDPRWAVIPVLLSQEVDTEGDPHPQVKRKRQRSSVPTGHFQSSGVVPGSLVLKLRPQLLSQNEATWEVYSYPWTLSSGSLTCITIVSMVTNLMPKINILMSYCAHVSPSQWWDGTGSFEVPYRAYQCHWTFRR